MNLAAFAKLIGMDEDALYDLDYEACCALIRRHGYQLTGNGIVKQKTYKQ